MHFIRIRAPLRIRRAVILLAVCGLLGFTGVLTGVRPASAGPLAVTSFFSTDGFGNTAVNGDVWTTEAVTLTVTANANVGGDLLRIIDPFGNVVASCSNTQTCSTTPISHSTVGEYGFEGEIWAGGQVISYMVDELTWEDFPVSLQATQTTVPVGQAVTLTATTQRPLNFAEWYIEVFDETDGHQVCISGGKAECQGQVSEAAATTHKFTAFIADDADTFSQLGNVRSQSADWYVTWSNDGWQVSLSAPEATFTGTETVTATANMSVSSPSPYYIEIFDETTGQRICVIGSGTQCSDPSFAPSTSGDDLVAFVSLYDTALPPSGTEASSSVVHTVYEFIQ